MENAEGNAAIAEECLGGTETVLLAEDDQPTREQLRETLQQRGYRVIEACDGKDAVDKFREYREAIDLAILDVIMPKINGCDVYRVIISEKPETSVIFTSRYPFDAFDDGFLGSELNFVSKFVAPEKLLRVMRQALDG